MQQDDRAFLFEKLQVYSGNSNGRAQAVSNAHRRRSASPSDRGGLLVSPDGSAVAVVDATATCLTLLHFKDEQSLTGAGSSRPRQDLAPCTTIRTFQPTKIDKANLSEADGICAFCWSDDGTRLAVACASGHVYILDRLGLPVAMLPPTGTPWAGKRPGAVALLSPSQLLLLTARPPLLFAVPLGGGPASSGGGRLAAAAAAVPPAKVLAALRPQSLGKVHGVVRTAVYDARNAMLVVAGIGGCCGRGGGGGDGRRRGGGASATSDVSISAWRLEVSGGGTAVKAALLGAYVGPVDAAAGAAAAAWPRSRWALSLSPLAEHAALCVAPGGGEAGGKGGRAGGSGGGGGGGRVLVVSLPQCRAVDPAGEFAGRAAQQTLTGSPQATLAPGAAVSVAWWAQETRLALADVYGRVGLVRLPGYDSLIPAWEEQPQFAAGSLVATKTCGPGPRGILVLEPTAPHGSTTQLQQLQHQQKPAAPGAAAAAAAAASPPPPGVRLVLLAERSPEQMLQVLLRRQQWAAALQLCASFSAAAPAASLTAPTPTAPLRLNADRVYAARWASAPVDAANIAGNLAKIGNRRWVAAECVRRVAADYPGQRLLLAYGLRETSRWGRPAGLAAAGEEEEQEQAEAEGLAGALGSSEQQWQWRGVWWRAVRLLLLRLSDRMEALYEAQGRTFDPAAYASFRCLPLPSAAASWAALGALGPLGVLCARHPAALSGRPLLRVLAHLPETISPRLYGSLIPRADGEEAVSAAAAAAAPGAPLQPPPPRGPVRPPDWVESPELLRELQSAAAAAAGTAGAAGTATATAASSSAAQPSGADAAAVASPAPSLLHVALEPEDDADSSTALPPGGSISELFDPEATDVTVRILDPGRSRLSAAALSEWVCERALQLDERAGQLQAARVLLELGWERGARGPRVAQLLGAARALSRAAAAAANAADTAATRGEGAGAGLVWRLGLRDFAGLPGAQRLRVLLAGSAEERLERDLADRVLPVLHGPGTDPSEVGRWAAQVLAEEVRSRPGWAAELVAAEARAAVAAAAAAGGGGRAGVRRLFPSAVELGQAVHAAVLDCPHTDEWGPLRAAVEAALRALQACTTAELTSGAAVADTATPTATPVPPPAATADPHGSSSGLEATAAVAEAAVTVAEALRRLRGVVQGGQLLAARGLPLTVRHICSCGPEEAARCVRQVLGRVMRGCPAMSAAGWSELWADLMTLRTAAFLSGGIPSPAATAADSDATGATGATVAAGHAPDAATSTSIAAAAEAESPASASVGPTPTATAVTTASAAAASRCAPLLPARLLLSELCRCLLHCGRTDLAAGYLREGAPDGEGGVVTLEPEAADALIASAAAEILAGANDPWDSAAQQAAACLSLASSDSPPAAALARLMRALQLLPDLVGLDEQQPMLLPVQVMQMKDRFDVIRMVLEPYDETSVTLGGSTAAVETGAVRRRYGGISGSTAPALSFAKAAAAAFGGGRGSRRRAAVRAAGQAAAAGGRAAAVLAGGLLAVAGRVAPNMTGAVADRVVPVAAGLLAGAVTSAAGVPLLFGSGGVGGGVVGGGGSQPSQPPYKRLGRLLEVAELLGLDRPEDELRIRDLAARAALRAGDLPAAQHLALGLLAAAYVPAWSLCADLGSCRRLADVAVRRRLLSYALLHCPPERLTWLLEELAEAEQRAGAADASSDPEPSSAPLEAPDTLLRRALLAPPPHLAPGSPATAVLPSLGDTRLALAVLARGGGAPRGSTDRDACKLLEGLRGGEGADEGGSGSGGGGGGGLPYAQWQRVVAVECACHCLRALLPEGGGGAEERLRLMQLPLEALLQQVRELPLQMEAGAGSQQEEQEEGGSARARAAAAALKSAAALAAARDSRLVRQHVPNVDAAQFCGGDSAYRRQALLQQAALAGRTDAAALQTPPSSQQQQQQQPHHESGSQLLEQARQLAAVYGIDPWDVELHYLSALMTAAPAVTPELRAAVQSCEPRLLPRPRPLLEHLAGSTYPQLPPASGPHLALLLGTLTSALQAAAAKDDPTAAALATAAAPLLTKLRELLDKAAAALKGLALTHVLAPLLAALLAPLHVQLLAPTIPSASDTTPATEGAAGAPATTAAAAAALFAYVKPSSLPQAAKLLAALHKLLGPLAKKQAPPPPQQQPGQQQPQLLQPTGLLVPGLQRVLDELPPSLPYLCLCVKAVGYKAPPQQQPLAASSEAHAPERHQQTHPPQRDMATAWGHIAEHVVRLPPAQLGAWLAFLQLPGAPCPLDPRVTGAMLLPCPTPAEIRLTVLDVCMPKLQPTAPPAGAREQAGGSEAGAGPDAGLLAALRALQGRLRLLHAAREHAAERLGEEQLDALEALLLAQESDAPATQPPGSGGGHTASALRDLLSALAASGCPVGLLLGLAAAAAPSSGTEIVGTDEVVADVTTSASAAADHVAAAVGGAVDGALEAIMREAADATAAAAAAKAGEDITTGTTGQAGGDAAGVGGLARLRGVLRCLESSSPQPAAAAAEADAAATALDPANDRATTSLPQVAAAVPSAVLWSLRDGVWRRLQGFTEGRLPVLERLAPAAASQLLDLQAALGTTAVWPDWSGGASADPLAHRLRVLLARTRALLTHLAPLPPPPAAAAAADADAAAAAEGAALLAVDADDLESCEAAERLFERLVEHVRRSGGGGDDSTAVQPAYAAPLRGEQLRVLWRLLSEVWQDGAVWSDGAEREGGVARGPGGEAAAMEAREAAEEEEAVAAAEPGVSDVGGSGCGGGGEVEGGSAYTVSPLRRCWRLLALELLRAGLLRDVVRLLDPARSPSAQGKPSFGAPEPELGATAAAAAAAIPTSGASPVEQGMSRDAIAMQARRLPLSESDVQELVAAAAASPSGASAAASNGVTSVAASQAAVLVSCCLGLASPFPEHRRRALEQLLAARDNSSGGELADRSVSPVRQFQPPQAKDVAVLLAALLVRSGDVVQFGRPAAARSSDAAATEHCHPLLPKLVALLPAAAAATAPPAAAVPCGVLACLAAVLAEQRLQGLAAALVARRLRLHPSLAAAAGSSLVLERYLQAVAREAERAGAGQEEGGGSGHADREEDVRAAVEAAGWPAAVVELWKERGERCRRALRAMAAARGG